MARYLFGGVLTMLIKNTMLMARKNIVKSGLVLWLEGKDFTNTPQTTSWRDRSGLGNNGTPINMAYTTSSGSDGVGGVVFDGVDDKGVCATSPSLDLKQFTIIVVVRAASTTGVHHLLRRDGNTTDKGYYLLRTKDLKYNLQILDHSALNKTSVSSISNVDISKKTFIAGTVDNALAKLFINGNFETSAENLTADILGTGVLNVGYSPTELFNGDIFTTLIYNRALTNSEIRQNYNALR